ncbi:MAG: ABC transporter [Bdellovibrio sp. CG10_big_fil_rev_8_21_14_0_10_47_8]|nr:MAG: ABC transporter [Bdellovibrio sp. CG10_big_fil_rev_8_21_14_0_10_47_8]
MKQLKKIKSSVFQRGLSLTKLTLNTGSGVIGHGISSLFSSPEQKEKKWQEFLTGQAKLLSRELGELKGSLMKAGQMISMYGELFLPPEANDFLKTLQSQSPPLQFEEIRKIIEAQLGPEKIAQLEIDPVPVGAASLGQVHKARIKASGEMIALKVQYPGVDKAIQSDLKAMKKFLGLLNLLPGELQTEIMFREVEEMLQQEINYPLEAQQTENYGKIFGNDPRFVIPKIYREFCSDKIIATSFESGLSPDDSLVKALSQERRNKLSAAFLELYFRELFEQGLVQTDPHLGNYKIRLQASGQDQLVLLDFGAVRQYEQKFLGAYQNMISASLHVDLKKLETASLDLKFIADKDSAALKKHFEEFCLSTVEPFRLATDPLANTKLMDSQGLYDWKSSDLPRRLTNKALLLIKDFPLRSPPREIIFLDRKTGGVFIFMAVLGARINARELILKYLDLPKKIKAE